MAHLCLNCYPPVLTWECRLTQVDCIMAINALLFCHIYACICAIFFEDINEICAY